MAEERDNAEGLPQKAKNRFISRALRARLQRPAHLGCELEHAGAFRCCPRLMTLVLLVSQAAIAVFAQGAMA